MEAPVVYFRGVLSGLAAIFLGLLLPGLLNAFRGISLEKATGVAAVAGGFVEAIFSPIFWILAIGFAALFFWASQLQNRILRVSLFWVPTFVISAFGLGLTTLFAYLFFRFRRG